eukprot:352041-Chlamydomonas_euryale.AAC.1
MGDVPGEGLSGGDRGACRHKVGGRPLDRPAQGELNVCPVTISNTPLVCPRMPAHPCRSSSASQASRWRPLCVCTGGTSSWSRHTRRSTLRTLRGCREAWGGAGACGVMSLTFLADGAGVAASVERGWALNLCNRMRNKLAHPHHQRINCDSAVVDAEPTLQQARKLFGVRQRG